MAPTPPLLNATCVALETVDYLSKCSFIPLPCKNHLAWRKVFLIVIGTLLGVVILCAFNRDVAKGIVLEGLWRTPTEKLPEEVYKKLLATYPNSDFKMGEDLRKFKGRITSSKFETDEEHNTKVITVVEDRSKIPSAQGLDFRLPNSAAPLLVTEPAILRLSRSLQR
jgi:hypothetical protein